MMSDECWKLSEKKKKKKSNKALGFLKTLPLYEKKNPHSS